MEKKNIDTIGIVSSLDNLGRSIDASIICFNNLRDAHWPMKKKENRNKKSFFEFNSFT